MSFPISDDGVASGLLFGILFGYVLESAGFGSPRKLTAQFRFTDWSVFKVMFTAIIVAAAGLAAANATGVMKFDDIFIPTTYFWATLAGGALVGAGMAIGGYCPGTSAAGFASGRLDAFVFMAGMIVGTGAFAAAFDFIKPFYLAAAGPEGQTLQSLFGISDWAILAILLAAAVGGFALGGRLERAAGGALTAQSLDADAADGGSPGPSVVGLEISQRKSA
ncbi:MAG: YeeE/YedE family protein [Hyphomicrobiales bacterium]|nr:YeeE/YedE family protein [Hyphomicrobiales bacterium]